MYRPLLCWILAHVQILVCLDRPPQSLATKMLKKLLEGPGHVMEGTATDFHFFFLRGPRSEEVALQQCKCRCYLPMLRANYLGHPPGHAIEELWCLVAPFVMGREAKSEHCSNAKPRTASSGIYPRETQAHWGAIVSPKTLLPSISRHSVWLSFASGLRPRASQISILHQVSPCPRHTPGSSERSERIPQRGEVILS